VGKLIVTAFTTLDNVAEDPHLWSGPFFAVEGAGKLNDEVLREADALLLGRVTYDGFAPAWSARSGDPFADKFNAMPKYAVSTTLESADWNNTSIIRDDVVESIRRLKSDQNVLVWGSPTLLKTLMENGLVDEFVLLVSPIVRGAGKKYLPEDGTQHNLRVAETRQLEGGMFAVRLTPAAG
jgi:dihydrofolate reductase